MLPCPPAETTAEMEVDSSVIPSASNSSSSKCVFTYEVERFDYSAATDKDHRQIGELYRSYFAFLGLIFDPSLDTDFVRPLSYYHHGDSEAVVSAQPPNGAFFVVRRRCAGRCGVEKGSCDALDIVGTVGVRAFRFPTHDEQGLPVDFAQKFRDGVCGREAAEVVGKLVPNDFCELKRMILHPECQGKGLGKRLLTAALKWAFSGETSSSAAGGLAQGGGFKAMLLDTKRWLAAANRLYERHGGFVECGNYNGNYRADRFMISTKKWSITLGPSCHGGLAQ